jgi:hypothetical protein
LCLTEVVPLHVTERARFLGGFVLGTALFHRKRTGRIAVNSEGEEKRTGEYRNLTEKHWFDSLHVPFILNLIIPETDALVGSNAVYGGVTNHRNRAASNHLVSVRTHKK